MIWIVLGIIILYIVGKTIKTMIMINQCDCCGADLEEHINGHFYCSNEDCGKKAY